MISKIELLQEFIERKMNGCVDSNLLTGCIDCPYKTQRPDKNSVCGFIHKYNRYPDVSIAKKEMAQINLKKIKEMFNEPE